MFLNRFIGLAVLLLSSVFSSQILFANEEEDQQAGVKRAVALQETPLLYFGSFSDRKNLSFEVNLGVGCLRFSGVRGNFMGRPQENFRPLHNLRDVPYKGRLDANKSLLFEYLLAYQYNRWLKVALSYQHQGGVGVSTSDLPAYQRNDQVPSSAIFSSDLALDALLLKVYFDSPWGFLIKRNLVTPYLAVGVGPGWQSWTRVQCNYFISDSDYFNDILPLRQKISANAVWMWDAGFKVRGTRVGNGLNVVFGCKYNQWGQAKNIGGMSTQGMKKYSIAQPFRIKTVYQFAPYLGVQWNFPDSFVTQKGYQLKGKSPNRWLPYWAAAKSFQPKKSIWTQFNVGVGFLYFSGIHGNFMGQPRPNFVPANLRDVPFKRGLAYNRTPLFEYVLGYQFSPWFKSALSIQNQSGVVVNSRSLPAYENNTSWTLSSSVRFISNLSLNGILMKLYFESPWAFILKKTATAPYLAVGVGPGWQSWTAIRPVYEKASRTLYNAKIMPFHQKISANAVFMVDVGFRVQDTKPDTLFSMLCGCKYNQWGQARNIGKLSQQDDYKVGFKQPFRIKTVYQFAPYLGVQWNFSSSFRSQSPYILKGKSPNVWIPYFVSTHQFQCSKSLWTQFNMGVGMLYFAGIKGNLTPSPLFLFIAGNKEWRDVPFKGRLMYNRSPLFEYLLGYRFFNFLSAALSVQHQAGVNVSTKTLSAYPNNTRVTHQAERGQFEAALELNALLLKIYFESPWAMIWKNLSTTPFIALGVGPGWQCWSNAQMNLLRIIDTGTYVSNNVFNLKTKISANVVFMVDMGLRIQSPFPATPFSVLLGCKYNQWGQARNIGKFSQQGSHKWGFAHPFRIQTVYQFAPYLGVQWNF